MATTSLDIERAVQYRMNELRSRKVSAHTLDGYKYVLRGFTAWLKEHGYSADMVELTRDTMREYIADLNESRMPATVAQHHRLLSAFFKFLVEDGLLEVSPMQGVKAPKIPQAPPAVLTAEDFERLLKTVAGTSFEDRRDKAILMMLMDTPLRRAELAAIRIEDVDLEQNRVYVTGKGDKGRYVGFGPHTAKALMRYLMERDRHLHSDSPMLWLGQRGKMHGNAIYRVVKDRAAQAGLPDIIVHQFRHTFANNWLSNEGTEGDLMALGGWSSTAVMRRYGSAARSERALRNYASRSPLSRIINKDK